MVWGRARDWTEEDKQDALERIYENVASGVSVTRTLQLLEKMPSGSLFWGKWHFESEEIQTKLARAREAGVEALMEQARDIAAHVQEGEEITEMAADEDSEGTVIKRVRKDMLGHRKLQVETIFKYAQMIAPRKYGPRVDVTSGGQPMTGDMGDIAARAAALLAQARERKGGKAE